MIGGVRTVSTEIDAARFAPISLDELVSQAGLMTRLDRKYLVPHDVASTLVHSLDSGTRVLEIDGRRDFAYDSVYFDTDDSLAYRLTAQKRRRRFKVRTRSYLDTGTCFLEIKTKSGRGATVKQRTEYDRDDRSTLTATGRDYARQVLCAQGHDASVVERLQPSVISRYHRTTLLLPGGSRATIDTRLHWCDLHRDDAHGTESERDHRRTMQLAGHAIIETKSVGAASEFDRTLWRTGHRPTGISKFGTGTAALRSDLPHNKWSRDLRGAFTLTPTPKDATS